MTERPTAADNFRMIFEHAPLALLGMDADGQIVVASRRAGALLGYEPSELVGRHVDVLLPRATPTGHGGPAESILPAGAPEHGDEDRARQLAVRRSDGVELAVEVTLGALPEGMDVATVVTLTDLRRRDRERAAVALAERRTKALAGLGEAALERLDLEATMRDATALLVDETSLTGVLIALGNDQRGWRAAAACRPGLDPWATRGGAVHPTLELALGHHLRDPDDIRGVEIRNSAGPLGLLIIEGDDDDAADVAFARSTANVLASAIARAEAEEHLRELSLTDTLTGLANRARIDERLADFSAQGCSCAVMLLDIDEFKLINDMLGHDAGDRLLCEMAKRIASIASDEVTVARFGGDEFVVLMRDPPAAHDLLDMAQYVLDMIAEPVEINARRFAVAASIGVASSGPHASPTELLRGADIALYRAKGAGRARAMMFDHNMREEMRTRVSTEVALRSAIELDELTLAYQPLLDLHTGRLRGFEALLRWERDGVPVPPADFIPIAERSDLIEEVDRWVLMAACTQAATWNRHAAPEDAIHIAVNISARHATSRSLVGDVERTLAATGLPAPLLHVEITETALLDRDDLGPLEDLRALGVKLALDDFGTGYSSLAHLQACPIDLLKIDRSFIEPDPRAGSWHIVRAVLNMARALGITTVAEGIETDEQLALLREAGCDVGQGYLLGRPLSVEHAAALLAARTASGAHAVA